VASHANTTVCRCLEAFGTSIHPLQFSNGEIEERVAAGSDDTALAAFAQLGALRLKAQRCIITLASKDEEFILAESTRTLSLQSDLVHNARDALFLGTTRYPRDEGFSFTALKQWMSTKERREDPKDESYYYTDGISPHCYIISDLRKCEDIQKLMLVKAAPKLRFFAAVPIRTSTGLVVGSYAILDDRPRIGISNDEMVFMEDIADTIMGHLEAKHAALQRERGDRLIKGLALFSEGKDSLRDWWLDTHSRKVRGEGARRRRNSIDDEKTRNDRADEELGMTYGPDHEPHGRTPVSTGMESIQPASSVPKPTLKSGHLAQDKHEGFDLGREVNTAFARSSNLMREAMSAEGVAFIDADFHRTKESTKNQDSSTTDHETDTATGSSGPETSSQKDRTPISPEAQCALLGFSTKVKSTVRGFDASARHSSLPKAFIRSLIRRYPMGKVFNFHDGKALSSSSGTDLSSEEVSEGSKNSRSRKRRSREFVDAMTLGEVFSGPRSIAFLPLWDSRRERWRSCAFVWNDNRFLDKAEDITYLAAFSNNLMAELSRLDAIAADQAKATFISSISHELRSPLHGVLAGVELLQESDLNNYQQEMTTTISMAGKTLLDTINNILDFTKINSFTGPERKDRKDKDAIRNSGFKTADMGEVGVTSAVDLAVLTENVVDTTVTAKSFQASKAKQEDEDEEEQELAAKTPKQVAVVLSIAKRSNWNLNISPGSWTRVITNLLGNSLKYTKRGTITVSLQYRKSEDPDKAHVSLIIEDTGQGIGSEYLRNHLYTPFMQENTHAVGTGLGLSIVKQIIKDFGGHISFESELGRGTKVIVSFEATFEEDAESEIHIPKHPDGSKLKVALSKSLGKTDGDLARDKTIKTSTSKTCKEWLDCQTELVSVSDGADAFDVCILSEGDYDQWQEKRRSSRNPHPTPMIVLGSISASSVVRQSASRNAIFINQPFGPRKMARALAAAMQSRSQSNPNSENQTLGAIASSPSALHILTKPSPMTSNSDPPPTYTESRPSSGIDVSSLPSTPTSPKNNQNSRNGDYNNVDQSNLRKVLLVEDNSINMKLLVATMRKLKRPYTSASNGLEAVSAYSSAPASYALILMDISMPVMDGYTATELIRSLEEKNKWGRCTIIALTGVGDAEAKKRAFLAGVDDFMTKPVSMAKLGGIINNLEGGGDDNGNDNKNNDNQKNNKHDENRRQDYQEKGRQNGQHNPQQHAVQQPA
jgi:signal transduction histidine kinase/CheY-like chemotaxis protein